MSNKFSYILEWLKEYTAISSWLYFNAQEIKEGSASVNSDSGSRKTKEYIDGSYEATLPFNVSFVKAYDTEQSLTNLDALNEASNLISWIDLNKGSLYLGDDCICNDVVVKDESPDVYINSDEHLAIYKFNCELEYTYFTNDL